MPSSDSSDLAELGASAKEVVDTIRRNHALEHATITILTRRKEGRIRLAGRAGISGFHIYGDIPTEILKQCVDEALARLRAGEKSLAVSPFCGTNLAVTGLSAALASMIAGKGHRGFSKFIHMAEASILATVAAQPLGRLAQKHITTVADMDGVAIAGIEKKGKGRRTRHKIEVIQNQH